MNSKLRKCLSHRRSGNAGWAIAVVFIGLIIFTFIMIPITTAANFINGLISTTPMLSTGVDPNTNAFMDDLMFVGLAVMVVFGAAIQIIKVTQKRDSGEEVI